MSYYLVQEINGIQTSKRIPVRTLKEAKEFLYHAQGEHVAGKPISLFLKDKTLKELSVEYLEHSKSRNTELTYNRHVSVVKYLLKDIGNCYLGQITTPVVQHFQTVWKRNGLSNKTINNRSILLGTMLRFAIDRGYLATLPKIQKMKVDKRLPNFYTEEEIQRICAEANPFIRDYVMVFLHTGMRQGELQRLKWEDIDFFNRIVKVVVSKSHKSRAIPMSKTLYELLIRLCKEKKPGQIYLFEFNTGQPVWEYYHRFKKLITSLGIEGNIHKLRHTFASRLVQRGVPIFEVQHLLGHASVQTTQIYAHIRMDNLQRAVSVLDNADGTETGNAEKIDLKVG